VIGAGDIAARYVEAMRATGFLEPLLIASAKGHSAAALARQCGLRAVDVDTLLGDETVDLVLNLAPPLLHADLTRRALLSGKHVYSEKPLAGSLAEARGLSELAQEQGRLLACAPATILGPALQTARAIIDAGGIGEVVGARATMVYPGPDLWHHNPDHLFGPLAGPLFDMGIYHLSAIVALLGPVQQVQALASTARDQRTIRSGPRAGETFPVHVTTQVAGTLRLASGVIASVLFSFDGFGSKAPGLEIIGTRGSLAVAHPSQFDGVVELSTELFRWGEVPVTLSGWSDRMWAIGLAEAWAAFQRNEAPRCKPAFACHLVEVLTLLEAAAACGDRLEVTSSVDRPPPLTCSYDSAFRIEGKQ
jgi:predicted dehydrogenase